MNQFIAYFLLYSVISTKILYPADQRSLDFWQEFTTQGNTRDKSFELQAWTLDSPLAPHSPEASFSGTLSGTKQDQLNDDFVYDRKTGRFVSIFEDSENPSVISSDKNPLADVLEAFERGEESRYISKSFKLTDERQDSSTPSDEFIVSHESHYQPRVEPPCSPHEFTSLWEVNSTAMQEPPLTSEDCADKRKRKPLQKCPGCKIQTEDPERYSVHIALCQKIETNQRISERPKRSRAHISPQSTSASLLSVQIKKSSDSQTTKNVTKPTKRAPRLEKCSKCTFQTRSKYEMDDHKKSCGIFPFSCPVPGCTKSFADQNQLDHHQAGLRSHSTGKQ